MISALQMKKSSIPHYEVTNQIHSVDRRVPRFPLMSVLEISETNQLVCSFRNSLNPYNLPDLPARTFDMNPIMTNSQDEQFGSGAVGVNIGAAY
jgi:hypothetical protein